MSLRIEETFQLEAPIDRVWAYLSDPRQVVNCLPGAELTSVESETIFLGKVKIKVGPVTAAYSGRVTILERDDAAYVIRLLGDGRESSGGGSAKMTMSSTLLALPTGVTEVRLIADLDIVGRLVQFGRGMIESVNKQMLKQFTDCLRATLETGPGSSAESGATPAGGASAMPGVQGAGPAASSPATAPTRAAGEPVRLLPILLRAARENLARVLGTLRGLIAGRSRPSG
jgi:carbon monoxide dehydrogenase subunit G